MTLKNRIGKTVLGGAIALTTISAAAQTGNHCNTAPKAKGVYITLDGKWTPLQPVSVSGFGTKGGLNMAKLAIPGAAIFGMNPKSPLLFRDPTALVQITSASSVFCLVGESDINPRDIQVVRLQVKKDHRELELAKGGLSSLQGRRHCSISGKCRIRCADLSLSHWKSGAGAIHTVCAPAWRDASRGWRI
jgi:hypothetical protein